MYKVCCPTYETASLRMFKYGRTDVIHSTTMDSFKFVQAMEDPAKPVKPLLGPGCDIYMSVYLAGQ